MCVDDVESLGERRYAFLSSGKIPDEPDGSAAHPKSRDCFLAGIVAHLIVFDVALSASTQGAPPKWDRAVDADDSFQTIHAWFEKALSWTSSARFADAGAMLDAFNAAANTALPSGQTLTRLERYRVWKTQRQISTELPCERDISANDFSESWMSHYEGAPVFVKMWKSSAWGGRQSELPRILDFVERADYLRISPPPGCAPIRKVAWMPDAIVVLREWIDFPTLQETIAGKAGPLASAEGGLLLIGKLCRLIVDLHQSGFAHGDLKPANILVPDDLEKTPVLIDFLEFSTEADGDVVSAAYAPASGGDRFSRDRFALTKMAEEVFLACEIGRANAIALTKAIRDCREGPPANATLLPLSDRLLPYHAARVETAYKQKLQADLKNRMRVAARNLGISAAGSDHLLHIHQSIRPVWIRYRDLIAATEDGTDGKRLAGLRRTIVRMAGKIGASEPEVQTVMQDGRLLDALTQHVASEHSIGNLDIAERFASIFNLTTDLIGSVSTPERSFESFLAGTRQIVAGTCVGLGRTSLGLRKTPFDLVVVDEAARCTSSELAVPIQSGRWIVLVGDQAQLEPHHRPEVISEVAATTGLPKREIVRSDFERIFDSRYGREAGRKLTQQHRMLAPIGRMVSASFCLGKFLHRPSRAAQKELLPGVSANNCLHQTLVIRADVLAISLHVTGWRAGLDRPRNSNVRSRIVAVVGSVAESRKTY